MKKVLFSLTSVFLILFLIIGCTLESKFSLPNDEKINPELIGEWYSEPNTSEGITILKNSDKTYKILFDGNEKTVEFIAFSKTIKGFSILNLKTKSNDKVTNAFYKYIVKDDSLIFWEVNQKFQNTEFESAVELLAFFEENIENSDFFNDQSELKRK
jgi:hypothetical protein